MPNRDYQKMFMAAGMPKNQIESVLDHFHATGEAADITTVAEYDVAKSIYVVMDASVPSGDFHSPVARYLISLGAQISGWEDRVAEDAADTSVSLSS
ncbi:hypothetical protein E4L95_22075 [Paracoccus liaowanqingii]|uniref:Uncharacterized protein n=1 Tax=Paracoccus liaowanqingii TaxID=2560053 RepID=A0A4Z1C4I7_9RHOB|nr:hypothetical protein [Paracoccus liaowanqingii]TGN37863.1 hypothetical protein E4L95_22075 [Paracoccus liaowanqingii]